GVLVHLRKKLGARHIPVFKNKDIKNLNFPNPAHSSKPLTFLKAPPERNLPSLSDGELRAPRPASSQPGLVLPNCLPVENTFPPSGISEKLLTGSRWVVYAPCRHPHPPGFPSARKYTSGAKEPQREALKWSPPPARLPVLRPSAMPPR